ncbi:MAG: EamA family transporter RarD [Pseudomonadota bacterium]
MTSAASGIAAMIAVCAIWGLSPLYYGLLAHVPSDQVLAHRGVWALALFLPIAALRGDLGALGRLLGDGRQRLPLMTASAAIAANWFLFILATAIDRVTESSLGYYIFPLMSVAVGAAVLGERLSFRQWAAVGLAVAAVVVLGAGLGALPWISLGLALTMTLYALMKRYIAAGPLVSVTAEAVWIAPASLVWIVWSGSYGHDAATWALLVGMGPITAIPLMLFSFAAQRVSMGLQGFLMYLNPTIQGAVAVMILNEALTGWHMIAFPLIWAALCLYSVEAVRKARAPVAPAP